jgi:tRNA threonylcarbamoyladenosine modification (KEOPS) complex Cgi121 subunit
MDFISQSFPDNKVHIALYKLNDASKSTSEVSFPENQERQKLAEIAKTHQSCLALVNATYIASLMHLNIAVARSLVSARDGKLRTESLGNEIVYNCSPNHSIKNALDKFGVKNC